MRGLPSAARRNFAPLGSFGSIRASLSLRAEFSDDGQPVGGSMCRVRAYLPTTLDALASRLQPGHDRLDVRAVVVPANTVGFAVTASLREWYREGDIDQLEYVALTHAARASLRQLTLSSGAPRRVVLAVDVADSDVVPAAHIDVAAVRLGAPVLLGAVAAMYVDDLAAADDVAAAARVVEAADAGDDDARFVVDGLDDHELQWYAVQEIGALLG